MVLIEDPVVFKQNYDLFCTIMGSVHLDNRLWDPAQRSLSGAFNSNAVTQVDDPKGLLDFLHYHFWLHDGGVAQDVPIGDALCLLAFASVGEAPKEVAKSDFTNKESFRGLCYALRKDGPYLVKRACVFLLSHLDDQLFNTANTFPAAEAEALVTGWAHSAKAAVDTRVHEELRQTTLATLMSLLDSSFWRKFIPPERWDFLRHVGMLDDPKLPRSFYRCLENTDVIPHLKQVVNKEALLTWLVILWTKYPDVSPEVKTQLETETIQVTKGQRNHIFVYLSIMDEEIKRIGQKVEAHYAWSFDQEVVELRARRISLREAYQKLLLIRDQSG